MTPVNAKDYMNLAEQISSFRNERPIYIFKPPVENIVKNIPSELKQKIGGVMGWGSEFCTSRVIFEKNQYLPGEKAKVKIICDNSKCKKAVQSFKFKLKRKIIIEGVSKDLGIDMTQNTTTNTYLASFKFPGCKGKETVERDFEIDIPAVDNDVAKKPGITLLEEEIPLLTTISSSFSGRLF